MARAGRLVAVVLAAAALHWAGLQGAARVLSAESVGRRGVSGPTTPVRLIAREWARSEDAAPAESLRPRTPALPVPSAPRSPPSADRGGPAAAPSGRTDAPVDADPAAAGYRFYGAKEVDVTAEPVLQWNLEPAELEALATSRIVFTLFVGRDGSVLHCSVDEPARLSPAQRKALAERIASTEMRPARRAGEPVPSRRRVEIYTTGGI